MASWKARRLHVSRFVIAPHALISRRALRIVAALTVVTVVTAGYAVSLTDHTEFANIWDGIWWASSTVTTVGYGDYVPATTAGRLIAIVLMFTGIALVSILTASIATALLAEEVGDEERKIDRDLETITSALVRIEARLAQLEVPPERPRLPPQSSTPGPAADS
ncbi:MAG: two pore domain potassium channel family protein [Gemmatimonadaceae bacterium]|nr:two pore domain potassium channel family protein [Gemmatimonadaceae bacterium]